MKTSQFIAVYMLLLAQLITLWFILLVVGRIA